METTSILPPLSGIQRGLTLLVVYDSLILDPRFPEKSGFLPSVRFRSVRNPCVSSLLTPPPRPLLVPFFSIFDFYCALTFVVLLKWLTWLSVIVTTVEDNDIKRLVWVVYLYWEGVRKDQYHLSWRRCRFLVTNKLYVFFIPFKTLIIGTIISYER